MSLLAVVAALSLAQEATTRAERPNGPITLDVRRPRRDLGALTDYGEMAGPSVNLLSSGPTQSTQVPVGGYGPIAPSAPLADYLISIPGVGNERFLFQETNPSTPRPLLVVFHRWGVSYYDALFNTRYFQEAWARGWYCVAPFGGNQTHFSSIPSQLRLEGVFDWIDARYPIDRTRVYGVGFSMGGNAAGNYAARHLDPDQFNFSGIVSLSGALSHEDTYLSDPTAVQRFNELFGGPSQIAQPWQMQRSSLFSFDPFTQSTLPNTDLARNLLHISTAAFRATGDIPYLMPQNDLLHQHMLSLGANPLQHSLTIVPTVPFFHAWNIANERNVCDWLRTKRLQLPSSGSTLADRGGRWIYFEVEQDVAGAFTPFDWDVQTATNVLSISKTRNLTHLKVHTIDAGIDRNSLLTVGLANSDGAPDLLTMLDWPIRPTEVLKDGLTTADWNHDGNTGELTLLENDSSPHVWTVVP